MAVNPRRAATWLLAATMLAAGAQAHAKGVRALGEAQRAIVSARKAGEATSLQSALSALTS